MAQRAGDEPFLNVRVQVADLSAAHRFNEILEVARRTGPLFHLFAILVEGCGAGIIRDEDMTAFAFDDHANAAAFAFLVGIPVHVARVPAFVGLMGFVSWQAAHFKDQRRFFVIVVSDQRVRSFAVVLVAQSAADTPDARR